MDQRRDPSPQGFDEEWRTKCWMFKVYREKGWEGSRLPDKRSLRRERPQWLAHAVHREGRIKLPKTRKWDRKDVVDRGGAENVMLPIRRGDSSALTDAKRGFQRVQEFFGDYPEWYFDKPLGWGGFGLALKYRYVANGTGKDYVVKASLEQWENEDIRNEHEYTRKVARAAHCVQMIEPDDAGLPPRGPEYEYRDISEDDSSDTHDSSGDESRADEPDESYRRGRSRKPQFTDPALQEERRAQFRRHLKRLGDVASKIRKRKMMLIRRNVSAETIEKWQLHRKDYLILEYCEHGDLNKLIARVRLANEKIPNRILWSFWMCMVRACLGMSYPPRKFHPDRRKPPLGNVRGLPAVEISDTGKRVGNDLYEDLPYRSRRWAEKNMVHFDIDPRNILIDTIEPNAPDGEHRLIPKLKLADFGISRIIKPRKRNEYYMNFRMAGKYGYHAPEQFGPEWDHLAAHGVMPRDIPSRGGWEVSEQKIAGNYGPKTNIWGIGLSMWQLITGLNPPHPPTCGARPVIDGRRVPVHYAAGILSGREWAHVDHELRLTVARCMAHDPADRPAAARLLGQARAASRRYFAGETDEMIRAWLDRFLYNA